MQPIFQYLMLCMATAACAMTISKMKVALPLHNLAERWGQVWLKDLLSCPYCLCFWFSLFWIVVTQSETSLVGVAFGTVSVMAGATLAGGAMMRMMFLHEKELYGVRERLRETREELDDLRSTHDGLRIGNDALVKTHDSLKRENNRLRNAARPLNGAFSWPPGPGQTDAARDLPVLSDSITDGDWKPAGTGDMPVLTDEEMLDAWSKLSQPTGDAP
jgi:hypothetical protein